ncbi:hypothetical protein KKB83_02990 [Patescibacteria group bacterium]|nr:hypothetical protein [Patescibacteria group bacterium]
MNKTDFVNIVVLGWIKSDLIRMRDTIRPDRSEVGNINFPLALCTLSCVEYLGGFLIGKDQKFTGNVEKYINECFQHPDEYPVEILRDLIRNGLAHDYFPRGAISRNNKRPAIYRGRTYSIVLDAETMVNDFIDSLDVFVEKLEDHKYEARMQGLSEKIDEFKVKHKSFIENLERQPRDDDQGTPSSGYPDSINTTTTDPNIE